MKRAGSWEKGLEIFLALTEASAKAACDYDCKVQSEIIIMLKVQHVTI